MPDISTMKYYGKPRLLLFSHDGKSRFDRNTAPFAIGLQIVVSVAVSKKRLLAFSSPWFDLLCSSSTPVQCPILSGKLKVVVKTTVTVPGVSLECFSDPKFTSILKYFETLMALKSPLSSRLATTNERTNFLPGYSWSSDDRT